VSTGIATEGVSVAEYAVSHIQNILEDLEHMVSSIENNNNSLGYGEAFGWFIQIC